MTILLRLVYFALLYAVISGVLFPAAYIATGFPYFPKNLAISRDAMFTITSPHSEWLHILFFREGSHANTALNISTADVRVVLEGEKAATEKSSELPVQRLDYYFQEKQAGKQISGNAYGRFWSEKGSTIRIEVQPIPSGYDGVIVRTGFKRMFVSIGIFIFSCLFITTAVFWLSQKSVIQMFRK